MSVRVNCPGCGGPVVFDYGSSMVSVCPHCRSVVARGDRSVETLGKVADLVETGTLLKIGLTGKYEGVSFRLTGRAQLGHEAGGMWDEWYAAFDDNRWGWLAEAQGRFYLTFEEPRLKAWPTFDGLEPGQGYDPPGPVGKLVVAETGRANMLGAEGEIPYRLVPGETYTYADLSGPGRAFGTLDYSETPPRLFLGRQVTLDELGVPPNLRRETFELREVAAKKVSCPNCAGPLDLRAPDRTERVGCPYCGSLLDASKGDLKLLTALKEPPFELVIPLGSVGTFGDEERTVIGAFERCVTADGVDYPWQEYLLYNSRHGFEWLIRANNHWTRVKGIPAGDVSEGRNTAVYDGKTFRAFNTGTAVVRGVIGECYWKVEVGETAEAMDYIRPPELLSVERQSAGEGKEVNWSVGTYLHPADVEKAFDLKEPLPAPEGIAPNQPFPFGRVYKLAGWYLAALCVLGLLMCVILPTRKVHEETFTLRSPAAAVVAPGVPPAPAEKTQVFHTGLFDLKARKNVRVTVSCPNLTGWLVVEGDLVRQAGGDTQPFLVPLTFYSGTEGGEAWTEGEKEGSVYVSAQPAGQYSLRLEVEKEHPTVAGPLTVKVEQGVAHFGTWFLALVALALIPLGVLIYHAIFASRRWANADFSTFGGAATGGGSDDDSSGSDD